ncbi:hypothetical protein [Rhodoferax sp. BLA1]|uniref:hypothetical protein n=1 Tax=Rhodoferax sp. BLA1 TaxID=2576062 RepID=UPI0015D2B6BB|nr:hypothetical protein [Rhodoferax sp. BLA1]
MIMTPNQLRNLANARLTTRRKSAWAEQAEQALRSAAADLERFQREHQARHQVVLRSYGETTQPVYLGS